MIISRNPLRLTLLALLLMSACARAPAESTVTAPAVTANGAAQDAAATATRQPRLALEASDPSTVSLAAGQPQLVEFFAFWGATCQGMAPIVHGLEDRYDDRMTFSYLDIDDPSTNVFRTTLGFRYQPEFYLLDAEGNVIQKWVGPVEEQVLIEAFDAALSQ